MVPGLENAYPGHMAEVVSISNSKPPQYKKIKSIGKTLFYLEHDSRRYSKETGVGIDSRVASPKYKVVRILKPVINDGKKTRKN